MHTGTAGGQSRLFPQWIDLVKVHIPLVNPLHRRSTMLVSKTDEKTYPTKWRGTSKQSKGAYTDFGKPRFIRRKIKITIGNRTYDLGEKILTEQFSKVLYERNQHFEGVVSFWLWFDKDGCIYAVFKEGHERYSNKLGVADKTRNLETFESKGATKVKGPLCYRRYHKPLSSPIPFEIEIGEYLPPKEANQKSLASFQKEST